MNFISSLSIWIKLSDKRQKRSLTRSIFSINLFINVTRSFKFFFVSNISSSNYTNVLKAIHENIDSYIGIKINFTGYVYRVLDLNENQFVLARDMIVSSNFQSVVVGFLCEADNASTFENDAWVNITGEITKGSYHGDMPIVKVTEIKKVDKPNDEFVYPPDESYIPTNEIL